MKIKATIKKGFTDPEKKLKAIADITIGDCLIIKKVRLIDGEKGWFLSMPSYTTPDNKIVRPCHPVDAAFYRKLKIAVIQEYRSFVANSVR